MWETEIVPTIDLALTLNYSPALTRKTLMRSVNGFGPKSTSHFMRNTGLMRGWSATPIIDTHILKALDVLGFRCDEYDESEPAFINLAQLTGIPPLLLDAVLWCTYSNNWDFTHSDFDNFGINNEG